MQMEHEEELVQVILDGNAQSVLDVYTSKLYGWIKSCNRLSSSAIADVVRTLDFNKSDAAIIICRTLKRALRDIDEHGEYSEEYGNADKIKGQIDALKKDIQLQQGYKWDYLYELTSILKNGHVCFASAAKETMTDPLQVEFMTNIEKTTSAERTDIIMNIKDFSFMSPLLDEAVLSVLSRYIREPSSDEDRIELKKQVRALDYYLQKRPFPLCFGTLIIGNLIEIAARLGDQEFADQVSPFINKITPNVVIYVSLSRFYSVFNNRNKLIKSIKLAAQHGAEKSDFNWFRTEDNPWQKDEEVQGLIPLSIDDYYLYKC
ncbi:hypothetical protein GCM10011518_35830 [Flavobacterium limi]|uniref:Uncharacterized protein n=2 Tax=Flavobacterium limi TaxID=2045105 RepID=A0ABQ1URJ4_9FLAO|nr:hypothetical protein GCM10011518_35830 [Flavobacterium limi]